MSNRFSRYSALYYTHCNTLQHTASHCNTLQHTATHCGILSIFSHILFSPITCIGNFVGEPIFEKFYLLARSDIHTTCPSRVAECCGVLQCVAVCCSVLRCVAVCCSVLQCVAVCCGVLQCVAVRCSVLQCVAECCSVL